MASAKKMIRTAHTLPLFLAESRVQGDDHLTSFTILSNASNQKLSPLPNRAFGSLVTTSNPSHSLPFPDYSHGKGVARKIRNTLPIVEWKSKLLSGGRGPCMIAAAGFSSGRVVEGYHNP